MSEQRGNGEGTYHRRGNGTWQYRVRVGGRRVSGAGKSRKAAKDAAYVNARRTPPKDPAATWTTVLDDWKAEAATEHGIRATTQDQYVSLLTTHVVAVHGDSKPSDLTKQAVSDILRTIPGASARRSTYAAWSKLCDYATDRGLMSENVVRTVKRPQQVTAPQREATPEQMRAVLEAAKGHKWEIAAWLVITCGLRRGEVLGLRWSDVDLEGGSLSISGNLTRSSDGLQRGEPKTKRGKRQVPLAPVLVDLLTEHRREQRRAQVAAVYWKWTGLVMTNEVGGAVEPRNLSRAWSQWAEKAGLSDLGMHLGRHYAATMMLSSGRASVADVAAQIGHDPAMLLNTYAAAVADGQRAAANYLADSLTDRK